MSSSLTQLCDLVADVAMANATKVQERFMQLVLAEASEIDPGAMLTMFAFMNWTFAQGVWSNISKTKLRRDLQIQLKDALILRLAQALTRGASTTDVAAKAVGINDQFTAYLRQYNARMQALGDADSGTATLFAFEQIQKRYGLSAGVMNDVILKLIPPEGLSEEVESIAQEVNKAAAARRRGFFSKLFGSYSGTDHD